MLLVFTSDSDYVMSLNRLLENFQLQKALKSATQMNNFESQKGDSTGISRVTSTYCDYKHTHAPKHTENYDPTEKNYFYKIYMKTQEHTQNFRQEYFNCK